MRLLDALVVSRELSAPVDRTIIDPGGVTFELPSGSFRLTHAQVVQQSRAIRQLRDETLKTGDHH